MNKVVENPDQVQVEEVGDINIRSSPHPTRPPQPPVLNLRLPGQRLKLRRIVHIGRNLDQREHFNRKLRSKKG